MIAGGGDDHGLGVALGDDVVGVGDAGRGIAPPRLEQHLLRLQLGQLLADKRRVLCIGHHIDVLRRAYGGEAVEGLLDEGAAVAEEIQELLGVVRAAHGPETASDATGHNDAIGMRVLHVQFGA